MEGMFADIGVKHFKINIRTKSELDPKIYLALFPIAKIVRENNINVIHSQTRITQVMGEFLSRSLNVPHVSTCHGFFKVRLSRRIFPCWGRRVIAISQPVEKHLLEDFRIERSKVALIENGIEMDQYKPGDVNLRKQARKSFGFTDEPIIGMIARLSEVKGQDVLIRAMPDILKHFSNAQLMIVGEGKTEALLKKLVADLSLSRSVHFCPIVNKTAEILPAFDVFVMPSRQEGLGLSVMEAQAAGLPVVASNVGGIPMLIKDLETGILTEPENSQALAEKVVFVLSHPDKAKALGEAARHFVEKNFHSSIMTEKTIQVYKKVLNE